MEKILNTTIIWQGKKMKIESGNIDLANGHIVNYERAWFHWKGIGVMIIPITNDNKIILIEQFCYWSEQQEIMLPWWYREPEYSLHEIANKELQEEVGYKAQHISFLTNLHILPWYIQAKTTVVIAEWLEISHLNSGDELETIIVHTMSRDEIIQAIDNNKINDCRTIAALMYWKHKQQH